MDLASLTQGMRDRVANGSSLGATVKFDFGDDGCLYLDATKTPHEVSNENKPADCTIKISKDDFVAMSKGELDATMAFMMGKLRVEGSMGIAMKLSSVLG
ncbi:MAG: SCP2 sterol-binding domain-containing protein [Alphaproteobacteria bacterium]|nr:SCP2 sterol-binding domain-containing protein [Alphaproteobacteria bacterium]